MFFGLDYDEPVYRPPSEADSLILQLTLGCAHNACHFCPMYKSKAFRIRPVNDIARELAGLPTGYRESVRRVFVADGDALTAPFTALQELFELLQVALPNLSRVGIYASPQSLRLRSLEELEKLRALKLRILYFGLESGDDRTLQRMNKGATTAEMLALCLKAQQAGLKLSVTAILGLGGQDRTTEHAAGTARWVSDLSPAYFSLLTLIPTPELAQVEQYFPLSNGQVLEEIEAMLQQIEPRRTILRSNHASNLLHLAGTLPKDRERLLTETQESIALAQQNPDWYRATPDASHRRL